MKIIDLKTALEGEGLWESHKGGSFYEGMKLVEAKGWETVKVALRTSYGNKTHGAKALLKNDRLVLTGGIYCGSQKGYHMPYFVGIGTPITCEKCIQRGY